MASVLRQFVATLLTLVFLGGAAFLCGQELPSGPELALGVFPEPVDPNTSSSASANSTSVGSLTVMPATTDAAIMPVIKKEEPLPGVTWDGVAKDSLKFLAVMHAFRCATEKGTREGFGNPFFAGYADSVANIHGWADGDEFYVNYVGHPMEGAVASFIWAHNDKKYNRVQFGSDPLYWKGKARATGFAFAFSAQFELGPLSEASIGNIQKQFPQQGLVDVVVTPLVGMGWSIGEDALDRYLIQRIERRVQNNWVRILTRSFLNPSRSMANLMSGETPWHREHRAGVYTAENSYVNPVEFNNRVRSVDPPPGVAPFEVVASSVVRTYVGAGSGGPCVGGGGSAAFRIGEEWQIVADVNGCKMTGLPKDFSGDSLTYAVGPRWTSVSRRWNTHAQFLVGGTRVSQERIYPEIKKIVDQMPELKDEDAWKRHNLYTQSWNDNALALVTGAGVDLKFNEALSLRTALAYSRTWNAPINDINYRNSVQFSSGLILNMGTW